MERRLTQQGKARKADLLAHAARLFAEHGYHQTRVIDIVRAAGVAKGLFYWYFENKDAIFRELIEDTRRRLRSVQQEVLDGVQTPLGRLFAGTAASVRFMAEHRELYALMQIESQTETRFGDTVRDTSAVHAADTARVIEAGQRAGVIRDDDDPAVLAYGVLGTVLHWVYFHRTGRVDMTTDELAISVARFVARALAADDTLAVEAEREALGARVMTGTAAAPSPNAPLR